MVQSRRLRLIGLTLRRRGLGDRLWRVWRRLGGVREGDRDWERERERDSEPEDDDPEREERESESESEPEFELEEREALDEDAELGGTRV
jgi:hypothetical protein